MSVTNPLYKTVHTDRQGKTLTIIERNRITGKFRRNEYTVRL